jgi:hypothetical protein
MTEKSQQTRKIRPVRMPAEKMIGNVVEKDAVRSSISDLIELGDAEIDSHVRSLADKIRKLAPLAEEEPAAPPPIQRLASQIEISGSIERPQLEEPQVDPEDLKRTAERIQSLLADD